MRLRQLDERHLPAAAAWLRARLEAAEAARGRAQEQLGRWSLDALDARYGGRQPFAFVLARPLSALLVVGVVLVTGVGVAVVQEGDRAATAAPSDQSGMQGQSDAPRGSQLGPKVGDRTREYARHATDGLVDAVRVDPAGERVALVSLTDYRTPEQTEALLSGFTVTRVYLRAKEAGQQAASLPIEIYGPLLPALRKAYVTTARSRAAAQKSYQGYADTLRPKSTQDRAFRDLYASFAKSSSIEAREYAHNCPCVYAVLVTAKPVLLLSLNARPGVRAVEVAGPGLTVLQVQVSPLQPEVEGVVPRPSFAGLS